MNIAQLQYIITLNHYQSFSLAAEKNHVTQPTLSTQVRKLEEELGVTLFDRESHPLVPTAVGVQVIEQAKTIVAEINSLREIAESHNNIISGSLKVAVIPTLAPYLVPYFLGPFLREFPEVALKITEEKTENIVSGLKNQEFDAGIAATPINDPGIDTEPIFYEKLLCYMNHDMSPGYSNKVRVEDILESKVWVLAEGNCLRTQVFNLCNMAQLYHRDLEMDYESGSIETLMKLADREGGSTLIPELATLDLDEERLGQVKFIGDQNPVREISLMSRPRSHKARLFEVLSQTIRENLPPQIQENKQDFLVPI
ncbi:MAG: LysR substrate-binding domain-containing protein [Bacteroidota bacterium]